MKFTQEYENTPRVGSWKRKKKDVSALDVAFDVGTLKRRLL